MTGKTAILIFANSSSEELKTKKIQRSAPLFDHLNQKVLKIARSTGLPYFLFSEEEQVGSNFGERFTHAIASVFQKGYHNVISIGNDTPGLSKNHILRTATLLNSNGMVLGPSFDGGFYLMGMRKELFCKKQFLKLPWQTAQLTKCIRRLLGKKFENIVWLERLRDIDNESDLKHIVNTFQFVGDVLRTIILQITKSAQTFFSEMILVQQLVFIRHFFNKGSPFQI
ncbi:MAG: DUF2064 domain-containing protein [Bacteroidota bacterium]|nr:DUF2064 domain-containing protein [Bacteroidota bacterium]